MGLEEPYGPGRALHVTCKARFARACDLSQFCPIGRSRFVFSDLAMLVFVETMAGNTITIDLALGIASGSEFWSVPDLWVMHLKVAISEQAKIPVCDQHLSFNSKVLNDTDTLESCKIVSNSLVQLLIRAVPCVSQSD